VNDRDGSNLNLTRARGVRIRLLHKVVNSFNLISSRSINEFMENKDNRLEVLFCRNIKDSNLVEVQNNLDEGCEDNALSRVNE
jgi:hypothetical protein